MTPTEVAAAQRTLPKTVHRWRNRFEKESLDGLLERPRSGRPTVFDKEVVDRVPYLTTKRIPEEAPHWSTALVVKYAEVTPRQVRQIWAAADLRPHRLKTFKISNDPEFSDKVVDIVGLYMNPPENAIVLMLMKKHRFKLWIERSQVSPSIPAGLVVGCTTTKDTERPVFTQLLTL